MFSEIRSAAVTSEVRPRLNRFADDPHKWLYAPLEAGCALVRNPSALRNAFSYHPPYYRFEGEGLNYYDIGPQNSRGFRALKVWLRAPIRLQTAFRIGLA
jgi:glutamate/tyrosine decarboxylase-like PLP-dependent enzyme